MGLKKKTYRETSVNPAVTRNGETRTKLHEGKVKPIGRRYLCLTLFCERRKEFIDAFSHVPEPQEAVIGGPIQRAQRGGLLPLLRRWSRGRRDPK